MPLPRFFHLAIIIALTSNAPADWRPVTFTNADLRAKGILTGDGCQWVRALAIAPSDGDFMIWGTDVGGLFRSLDGGRNWEPANIGFHSRGSAGVAIDPHNSNRVLVVAGNSVPSDKNGLYLSIDRAASWRQTLPVRISATRDMRRQIAFDPSTYDAGANLTRVAYWSRLGIDPSNNPTAGDPITEPGFYKSTDGGESWFRLPGGEIVADAEIAVHPKNGDVYAATPTGLHVSRDGGLSWSLALPGAITGIAVSPAAPDSVWVTQADALLRSEDCAVSFTSLAGAASLVVENSALRGVAVAPSDPNRIALWRHSPNWKWPRFTSHDGGVNWIRSEVLGDRVIVPTNAREGLFSFHPSNPDIILAPGGDYPAISRDGGRTYALAGNGVNNIFIAGAFNFSASDPSILYLASQDYATLLTTDGGQNWAYLEPGKKGWGGYNYAAYASSSEALLVGEAERWGGPSRRTLSFDLGRTWFIAQEIIDPKFTYGDPRNPKMLFAGCKRSTDAGHTWTTMNSVTSVRTHDHATGNLYGLIESTGQPATLVMSSDGGGSWSSILTAPGSVSDLAVEPGGARIYIASRSRLFVWEKSTGATTELAGLLPDQGGQPRVLSVAVDPVDPAVIYIAGNRDIFASNASAQRSRDFGATWENLTLSTPLDGKKLDGGREAHFVRVNPKTREAWFATNCYGVWIYSSP